MFYLIVYVRKFESYVQIENLCEPWKIFNGAEKLYLADAAILVNGFLLQPPRRGKHKSLYS
jgi:hypothetical protein